jgi:hypothetical protein
MSVVEEERRRHAQHMRSIGSNNDQLEASLSLDALTAYLQAKATPLQMKPVGERSNDRDRERGRGSFGLGLGGGEATVHT